MWDCVSSHQRDEEQSDKIRNKSETVTTEVRLNGAGKHFLFSYLSSVASTEASSTVDEFSFPSIVNIWWLLASFIWNSQSNERINKQIWNENLRFRSFGLARLGPLGEQFRIRLLDRHPISTSNTFFITRFIFMQTESVSLLANSVQKTVIEFKHTHSKVKLVFEKQ